jgi:hypothetical protein
MPKRRPDARYEDFRAKWERTKRHRLYRERGRGKPGDMNYRPPLVGSPRPHKTRATDFLDELLWCAAFVGDDSFERAYVALHEAGVVRDGRWAKDFHPKPPPGLLIDPFPGSLPHVARLIHRGWSKRRAFAWAVWKFDLPGASFAAAVARMRTTWQAANEAGLLPSGL